MKKIALTSFLALSLALSACQTTSNNKSGVDANVQEQIAQLIRLGDKTRESGDGRNALGFYQRAYSLDTNNIDNLILLAEHTHQLGDKRASESLYQNALSQHPDNIELLRRYATILVELDKLPQALIQLQKAQTLSPNNTHLMRNAGVVYDLMGRHMDAQNKYKLALSKTPEDLAIKNNYALSLALTEQFDEAISLLKPYAYDESAPKRLRLNLALIMGLAGNDKGAAEVASLLLDRESVEHNLAIYKQLREMNTQERTKTVLSK